MNGLQQTIGKAAQLLTAALYLSSPAFADQDPVSDFLALTDACIQETSLKVENNRSLVEILNELDFVEPKQEDSAPFARRSQTNRWKVYVSVFARDPTAVPAPEVIIGRNLPRTLERHQEQVSQDIDSGANHYRWQSGDSGLALSAARDFESKHHLFHSSSWVPACEVSGIPSAAASALLGNPRYEFTEETFGQVGRFTADLNTVPALLVMAYFLATGNETKNDWVNARLELTRYPQNLAEKAGTSQWHLSVYNIPET